MSEPQTMYRAFFSFHSLSAWHPDSPVPVFYSAMQLSPCGQFVEQRRRRLDDQGWETLREEMHQYWQPTQAKAGAAMAPRLRQMGQRLIRQAEELEQAALWEDDTRPALADK